MNNSRIRFQHQYQFIFHIRNRIICHRDHTELLDTTITTTTLIISDLQKRSFFIPELPELFQERSQFWHFNARDCVTNQSISHAIKIPRTPRCRVFDNSVKSKGLTEITKSLSDVIRIYQQHGWRITSCHSDCEYNFEKSLQLLTHAPPHLARGSGNHDGRVEERIRRIKDNVRAIQAGLPYRIGQALLTWCVYYSTYVLNLMPQRSENTSPREIMRGIKQILNDHCPLVLENSLKC